MANINDCTHCFASRERQTIIDLLNPDTDRGVWGGGSLAEIRHGYPDAEIVTIDDFCAWKAEKQRTPVEWLWAAESEYFDMLNCLPPAAQIGRAFLVGEPYDHDAGNGQPRFTAYRIEGDRFLVSSRPVTIAEFRESI